MSVEAGAEPRKIEKVAGAALRITWVDDHVSTFSWPYLRRECPCANCVDEWTGARRLDPAQIAEEVHPEGIDMVGNYALRFTWSDRHSTGIYAFALLRRLCPCSDCAREIA
ncbi:MAG: DUF971 domain-containing protein [Armatimonadetes bacterium]|nr:DUF971 domain-containing protein [Armatimonadota bacterium]